MNKVFDRPDTPTYFIDGGKGPTPRKNAGVGHQRLHKATKRQGVDPFADRERYNDFADPELIKRYRRSYSDPALDGIRGNLVDPQTGRILGRNLTPAEAFDRLLQWAKKQGWTPNKKSAK